VNAAIHFGVCRQPMALVDEALQFALKAKSFTSFMA
jgi:hypothetical protein